MLDVVLRRRGIFPGRGKLGMMHDLKDWDKKGLPGGSGQGPVDFLLWDIIVDSTAWEVTA